MHLWSLLKMIQTCGFTRLVCCKDFLHPSVCFRILISLQVCHATCNFPSDSLGDCAYMKIKQDAILLLIECSKCILLMHSHYCNGRRGQRAPFSFNLCMNWELQNEVAEKEKVKPSQLKESQSESTQSQSFCSDSCQFFSN